MNVWYLNLEQGYTNIENLLAVNIAITHKLLILMGKTSVCREKVVVVTTIVARKKIVLGHNIFEWIGFKNSGRTHW